MASIPEPRQSVTEQIRHKDGFHTLPCSIYHRVLLIFHIGVGTMAEEMRDDLLVPRSA